MLMTFCPKNEETEGDLFRRARFPGNPGGTKRNNPTSRVARGSIKAVCLASSACHRVDAMQK